MAITGPLIRVLGERYSWSVKSAVLDAIYFLLLKVDITLKPFLPQLQPTFMKNLNDINKTVRLKSGYALSKLLFMNPKLDQIIIDIHNLIKNNDMSDAEFELLINDIFDYSKYSGKNWKYLQANCMVAATVLQHMSTKVIGTKHDRKYLSFITACINSDKVSWTCLRLSYTLYKYA